MNGKYSPPNCAQLKLLFSRRRGTRARQGVLKALVFSEKPWFSVLEGCRRAVCFLLERASRSPYRQLPGHLSVSEKVFVSQKRVSGFPEKRLTSGEVRGTSGEVRGTSGEVWETSGELFGSTVRELPGKSPKTSGEVRGTSREARGSLTPSQRLAKFVSKYRFAYRRAYRSRASGHESLVTPLSDMLQKS